jgi:uncharacterized protein (TIGR02246 family)
VSDESTTPDVVELLRHANDAWNRRDLDLWESLLSPDVVYRPIPGFTETQERRGRDEARRFAEEFFEAWAVDFVSKLDTVRVYGNAVVARVVFTGHGRTSGVEISERMFEVYFFEDGLITRFEDFTDREEALKAAGASD